MAQTLASGVVIPAPGDRISAAGVQEMRTLGATTDAALSGRASLAYVDDQVTERYNQAVSYASSVASASIARDDALGDQIAGMEGMTYIGAWEAGRTYRINDVVAHGGDSWARLTAGSAGEPGASPTDWGLVARKGDGGGFGELSETAVTGLYDTVASVGPGYDSGVIDVSGTLVPGWEAAHYGVTLSRQGGTVTLALDITRTGERLVERGGAGIEFAEILPIPSGFRPVMPGFISPAKASQGARAAGWYDRIAANLRIRDLDGVIETGARIVNVVSWQTRDPVPVL